jgi:hypothetical protein
MTQAFPSLQAQAHTHTHTQTHTHTYTGPGSVVDCAMLRKWAEPVVAGAQPRRLQGIALDQRHPSERAHGDTADVDDDYDDDKSEGRGGMDMGWR